MALISVFVFASAQFPQHSMFYALSDKHKTASKSIVQLGCHLCLHCCRNSLPSGQPVDFDRNEWQ